MLKEDIELLLGVRTKTDKQLAELLLKGVQDDSRGNVTDQDTDTSRESDIPDYLQL